MLIGDFLKKFFEMNMNDRMLEMIYEIMLRDKKQKDCEELNEIINDIDI